ncbi:MAG: NUDIX hydrolase [Betaproteobacteria bacterium]|nr:NUDIX hydrolase [Betaproteobacteria bacterium]
MNSPDSHLTETRLSGREVFRGKLLEVKQDTVRLPDGGEALREYIVHPGAVMIIPVLPDGALLLERQFRYPLARVLVEFPAGKLDPGEDPLTAAARELLEETGYRAGRWRHLLNMNPVVSYSNEQIGIYLAEDLERVAEATPDHGEFLETLIVSRREALAWMRAGRITDAKTQLGLLLLEQGW